MPLPSGTHLGPYEILGTLGAGGMGEVYRARDTRLERTVAVKILPKEMSHDPVRKQRFERDQDFWLLDLGTMHSRRLTRLNNPAAMRTFDITPDSRRIVFDRSRENSDIVLIDLSAK